jgi:hypothetical protein
MADKNPEWSANTIAYFELWKKTLHQNCKKGPCTCGDSSYRRTIDRLECMKRGMPDLHPDEEQEVWEIAFEIHSEFCKTIPGYREGLIAPTWSVPQHNKICNCFERALAIWSAPSQETLIEDYYYERVI